MKGVGKVGAVVIAKPAAQVEEKIIAPIAAKKTDTGFDSTVRADARKLDGASATQALVPQVRHEHDAERGRFVIDVPGSPEPARATYRNVRPGVIDYRHTIIPDAAQGQGLAGTLVKTVFDWARANGTKIIVTCPVAAKWLERHPEEKDVVVTA